MMDNYSSNNMTATAFAARAELRPQPEVLSEMDRLTKQCELLDKQTQELEARLESVLAQRSEVTDENAKTPEPVRVPLAQSIHERVVHLETISNRLQSIISRIEV